MSRSAPSQTARAVVAKRAPNAPVETDEIESLARANGDDVVATVTQVGPNDSGTYLGSGKLDELATVVADREADRVVVDDGLTPDQHHTIERRMPAETVVVDRYRLVLELFESQAGTRRAQLQVELARLQYDLPRVIAAADEGMLNQQTEKGSRIYDVEERIDRLETKLEELPDPAEQFRERRREEGFDLVTLAGYTNAGKSTLLHRLADDMSLEDRDEDAPADDGDATAAIEDRLFETLETTTRRATLDGRPALVTDTVGFVDELPHELVESFSSTLSEAAAADVVVLVADASDDLERFRNRLSVSLDVLAAQGVDAERIVPVVNKADALSDAERRRRYSTASDLVPEDAATPILASVLAGTNVEDVRDAIRERFPEERATLTLPNTDAAMSLVSTAHDRTTVESVDYEGETVELACRGRPDVLERLRGRAEQLE
ncbi:GTPase HflX [Natronococcus occultus]|uniref:GTPase HflX n=1 Tax=Natronococcus occultus SP4 TaxID=694430 RepID=L0JUE7_9EURY|nr:GTPase HflX [Natronococcus occultus]AGB36366.1 GTP-binding protein HflX [Natronococcus occultus SP4]